MLKWRAHKLGHSFWVGHIESIVRWNVPVLGTLLPSDSHSASGTILKSLKRVTVNSIELFGFLLCFESSLYVLETLFLIYRISDLQRNKPLQTVIFSQNFEVINLLLSGFHYYYWEVWLFFFLLRSLLCLWCSAISFDV